MLEGVSKLTGNLDEAAKRNAALASDQKDIAKHVEGLAAFSDVMAAQEIRSQSLQAEVVELRERQEQLAAENEFLRTELDKVVAENKALRALHDRPEPAPPPPRKSR
jgi:predicted  nucleic acid-binding Zn-ribbon protein